MGERVDALTKTLKMMDEETYPVDMIGGNDYYVEILLSHIAMNLAVIADKLTEDDNAKNERNEEVSMRPVPGEDMVASESVENANEPSSGDIQKNKIRNEGPDYAA